MRIEVIIDHGETANKCTIAPMAGRADFDLKHVGSDLSLGRLISPILLHHAGQCLSGFVQKTPVEGFAVIDCIWRRLNPILDRIEMPLPKFWSIPPGFITAYPRRSKDASDPDAGLATIEAIFIAAALLGNWDLSLLERYPFASRFIELNQFKFREFGVEQVRAVDLDSIFKRPVRNSLQRRIARGRAPVHLGTT